MALPPTGNIDFKLQTLQHFRYFHAHAPPLKQSGSCTSTEFGHSKVPIRGTFYKTNNGASSGTWINEGLNQPYFTETMPVFTLKRDLKVQKSDALKISRSTLKRISIDRPMHKQVRQKYQFGQLDETKNNKLMTLEDNINQS